MALIIAAAPALAIDSSLTYQGALDDGGQPANGSYDLQFTLQASGGATIGSVVDAVQRVSSLVQQISAATKEQSIGIAQVNEAVTQLDTVTQQNAALVEESTASAQDLKSSAHSLGLSVDVFKMP